MARVSRLPEVFNSLESPSESSSDLPPVAPREPILTLPSALTAYILLLAAIHAVRMLLPFDIDRRYHPDVRLHSETLRFDPAGDQFPRRRRRQGLVFRDLLAAARQSQPYRFQRTLAVAVRQRAGAPLRAQSGSSYSMAVTAAAGALAHLVTHEHAVAPMIGASASVSGAMAAAIRFAFVRGSFLSFSRGDAAAAARVPALSLLRALRDPRVVGFLAVWFGINIVFGVGSIAIGTDGASVAWQAHIGGFFAGLLLFSLFDPVPRREANVADASSLDVPE